jgi:hypothetical protein
MAPDPPSSDTSTLFPTSSTTETDSEQEQEQPPTLPPAPIPTPNTNHKGNAPYASSSESTTTSSSKKPTSIKISTFNIRDGRNNRLLAAAYAMDKQNVDIAFLTEVKIPESRPIHTRFAYGYEIIVAYSNHTNQGGIALLSRAKTKRWHIEAPIRHGPNIISCVLVAGDTRTPLIGAYLPPSTLKDLPMLTEAFDRFTTYKRTPILLGDLNVDLADPTTNRSTEVSTTLGAYGMEDLLPNFKQRRRFRDLNTHHRVMGDTIVRSRCDY